MKYETVGDNEHPASLQFTQLHIF